MHFLFALTCLIGWPAINRFAGMEKGDRYIGALLFSVAFSLLMWDFLKWTPVDTLCLSFIAWRSIGWYKSMDMGKDGNTTLRDYALFTLIAAALALPVGIFHQRWEVTAWLLTSVPLTYLLCMRLIPNNPKHRHIAMAEIYSGLMIGFAAYMLGAGYV